MNNFKKLHMVLGKRVTQLLILSFLVGGLLFVIEYSFAFTLQAFLLEISPSAMKSSKIATIPTWFPIQNPILLFLITGLTRSVVLGIKSYLAGVSNQSFLDFQRKKIFKYALLNTNKISTHYTTSLFTETLGRAASSILDLTVIITAIATTVPLLLSGLHLAYREMIFGCTALFLVLLPSKLLNQKIKNSGKVINYSWESINKLLIDGIKFNYFFVAHGLLDKEIERGTKEVSNYTKSYKDFFFFSALKNNLPNFFGILIIVIISFLSKNYFNTPSSVLVAFIYIFYRTAQGGSELIVALNSFSFNKNSLEKIIEFNDLYLESLSQNKEVAQNSFEIGKSLEIKVEELSFGYSNKAILKDLNFSIKRGQTLLIKGESGSGKSTIVSLLLGANVPQKGSISINNHPLNEAIENLKKRISYIGPEPYIFADTIRNNLLLGHPNPALVKDEMIHNVLNDLEISYFVNQFPDGLNHKFEEHANISTGQKQRLAIARGLLRDFDLIILDEATANLDIDIENRIINKLKNYFVNKVAIIITHKDSFDQLGTEQLILLKDKNGFNDWKIDQLQ